MTARLTSWWAVPFVAAVAAGCQPSQQVMARQLSARMSMIDFSGLAKAKPVEGLGVSAAVPRSWQKQPVTGKAMFTFGQWRSPDRGVAVGVVHVSLPLPMSAQTLVWLAKARYGSAVEKQAAAKHPAPGGPGRLLAEWTDDVGREWVEAENDKYHLRGYAVTCGFEAWLVYAGAKRPSAPNPVDWQLALRSMESVVPDPLAPTEPAVPSR